MRRMLLAMAVIVGMTSAAEANWGWGTQPAPQAPPAGNMYGWNPAVKKWFFWKKDDCGAGCGSIPGIGPGPNGGPQGTLVFPQHPYVRSPRDFFMWGH